MPPTSPPDLSGLAPRGWIAAATSPHVVATILLAIGIAHPGLACMLLPLALPVAGCIAGSADQASPRQRLHALVKALPEDIQTLPNIDAVVCEEWARRELRVGRERLMAYAILVISGTAFVLFEPYWRYFSPATRTFYSIQGVWPAYLALALCWLAVVVASLPLLRATMLETAAVDARREPRVGHLWREAAILLVMVVLLIIQTVRGELFAHADGTPNVDAFVLAWVCLILTAAVCVRGRLGLHGREQRAMAQLESLVRAGLYWQRQQADSNKY